MGSDVEPRPGPGTGAVRRCAACGAPFPAGDSAAACPACLLRLALGDGSGGSQPVAPSPETSRDTRSVLVPPVLEGTVVPVPVHLGHFVIETDAEGRLVELGRGAMGITYRAMDESLNRRVALKVIAPGVARDPGFQRRFIREARAAASLRHPNIASVYYLGFEGDHCFYAMELVEGVTLDQLVNRRGPLKPALALEIAAQVNEALGAAHAKGLVHRDIKPSNLMVNFDVHGRPAVKVIDFGLAKVAADLLADEGISTPGAFVGTPRFASPEQFAGEADIRSDLYALGLCLLFMLRGRPFVPRDVRGARSPLVLEQIGRLPQGPAVILRALLAERPADRPQTPEQVALLFRVNLADGRKALPLSPGRSWRPSLLSGTGFVVVVAVGTLLFSRLSPWRVPEEDRTPSVAVLPFSEIGDSKESDYLADGLTSEVIFQLSNFSGMRVLSRNAVLGFKGDAAVGADALRRIGEQLHARAVLESSLQRTPQRIRVISLLYDARSGERLWGETYDRAAADALAIQRELALAIAGALKTKVLPEEGARVFKAGTRNPEAYDFYLRGMAYLRDASTDQTGPAVECFRQALDRDPAFALAYVGLSTAFVNRTTRFDQDSTWLDAADEAARKAVDLDSAESRAFSARSRVLLWKGDRPRAKDDAAKALYLAPNDAEANLQNADILLADGELVRATDQLQRCFLLDPTDAFAPYALARVNAVLGSRGQVSTWINRAMISEQNPQFRRLIRVEEIIFRAGYDQAYRELEPLPEDLRAHGSAVREYKLACAIKLGKRADVESLVHRCADPTDPFDWFVVSQAVMNLTSSNHDPESADRALAAIRRLQEAFSGNDDLNWHHLLFAASCRVLGRKDEGYSILRPRFSAAAFEVPLLLDDPIFDPFREDKEFQALVADFRQHREADHR